MLTFKVSKHNTIWNEKRRVCPIGNKDPKVCVSCPNCLSISGFFGRVDRVLCRGGKIEK